MVLVLTACVKPDVDFTAIEEPIEDMEFTMEKPFLLNERSSVTITTDKHTLVWNGILSFVESNDDINKVTYETDDKGKRYNLEIHLNATGIKEYSKKYADTFGRSIEITNEN